MSDSLWPHGCSLPASSVHGISQARMLEWVAIASSRRSSWPRDGNCISCIGSLILYHWATREAQWMAIIGLKNNILETLRHMICRPICWRTDALVIDVWDAIVIDVWFFCHIELSVSVFKHFKLRRFLQIKSYINNEYFICLKNLRSYYYCFYLLKCMYGGGGQNFFYICSRQLFKSIKSKRSNWMKYEWKIYVCN